MKKIPLLFVAFALMVAACNNDTAGEANSAGTEVNPTPPADLTLDSDGITEKTEVLDTITGRVLKKDRPKAAISSAIGANPVVKEDPNKPVPVPLKPATPQQERIVRVLSSNYWIVQGLVRIKDKEASRVNPGAWFKFNPDGSYTYGHFQNTIGTGAWSLDGQKATVLLDAPLIGDDREWKLQIAKSEDVMVWVGTERYHTNNTNMKLINLLFIPKNRKEIGLE